VHFFDYQGDLYGTRIQVRLLRRIRDERKFDSLQGLKEQLGKDRKKARDLIREL
jgi:riboflavin kinase/FMN adenylyltransferase